jgi:predicted lipid-binding transport protein (Tim44 family)
VAGLAAGLGLAALASHLGFGEELANIMLIALLAMAALVVFRLLFRRRSHASPMQYAGAGAGGGTPPAYGEPTPFGQAQPAAFGTPPAASHLPADFDAEGFARQAKVNFLRLQAANDAGNLDDLREFTTPEMFAELQMDLRERGAAAQHTEVMDLQAEVLEVVEEGGRYVVSVRFHGLLREEAGGLGAPFDEVWHLVKPVQGSRGWLVAGIQQRG